MVIKVKGIKMNSNKLFISYCWSSTEHEEWVVNLASELRENGVDVLLDKWDLKEGHDANAFMERMVTDKDIHKVILVLDKVYADKANKRSGGVGTETQIISAEVYESVDQNKFVAVIAERDEEGKAKTPAFYKSRIYIDMSSKDLYGSNFEQLLRWAYNKPLHVKPELGHKPAFLDEESEISLETSVIFRRVTDAIRNSKPHASGALSEYFDKFITNFNKFNVDSSNGSQDYHEKVISSIESFIPFRNELIDLFSSLAQYDKSTLFVSSIHHFLESLLKFKEYPSSSGASYDQDHDNFKFIVNEVFVICISIFLKYERFEVVGYLLAQRYITSKNESYTENDIYNFNVFRSHLPSLQIRNSKLKLNRTSIHADLINERSSTSSLSFESYMQADFLLYITAGIQSLKGDRNEQWWPETLLFKSFRGGIFEIFLRAESKKYFHKLAPALCITQVSELKVLPEALKSEQMFTPKWHFDRIEPLSLLNFDKLCSKD
jgi:hypothetical protein